MDALPANARTYLQLDEYPLEFLREYFLEVEEWHHTSKHYNRTDFCRPSIAHWSTSTPEDVQNLYIVWLQRQKKAQAMKTTDTRKVRVTYISHPNLADGKTLAHVTFPEVGLGSARDEQGRLKH